VKRLREASSLTFDDWTTVGPYNDYRTAPEAADIIEQLAANIEALTTQLAEDADARKQIDHRLAELVGQVDALTAERDDYADQISNLLPAVNREAVEQRSRAEAAEKELQEMQAHIDHADAYHKAMLAAEAERDDYKRSATHSEDVVRAARAEIERLRAIGTEMAESIQGNYYLPSVATRWFTALKGQRPEPWPSSALKEAVDFAEQTFPYLAQKDNSHE
jgi:septal ring factor EnvC (AmiA/AmiB activator)